ncbi:hypothetical protein [Bartonella senegalensis]|uniref:phage major tropism determinant n=1 Tax=Bartonella senegalensis TaxID=1468418 RepID=UPI0002EEA45D|nr:hypothetical protein [Bartonella senegalensis]
MAAEEAKRTAGSAQTLEYQAKDEANKAKQLANTAKSTAESAKSLSEQTKQSLNTIRQELSGIKTSLATTTANSAKSTATVAQTESFQAKALAKEINDLLQNSHLTSLSLSPPFLVATGAKQLTLKKGTHIPFPLQNGILTFTYKADKVINISSSLSPGKDYYLYLVPDQNESYKIVLSENATYPNGYTVQNSKKIGGFHTLCADVGTISGHRLSGYRAGTILPNSVWCLNHRSHSSPEGMVYDPSQDIWVDIYLQSGTGEYTRSAYAVPITTNRSYIEHVSDMQRVRKSLLSDEEFAFAMYGSNEKTSIEGKKVPLLRHSGGHVDTANRRMISHIGCEDGCGYLWQFLGATFPRQALFFIGARQQLKTDINVLVGGGSWSHDGRSGSYYRQAIYSRVSKNEVVGARGRSKPRPFCLGEKDEKLSGAFK